MTNIGDLSADGYGIMIFSPDVFCDYLKLKKCRAKKYISYFDKNKEFFHQTIKDGKILPIYQLASFEYELFVSVNESEMNIPKDYLKVYEYNGFYIEVGKENKLCFSSFDFMEYESSLIKQNITEKSDLTPSGPEGILEKYNTSLGLEIEEGIYSLDIIGLKRKNELERESKNFGYLMRLTLDENIENDNFLKADNDNCTFDILQYEKQ
ncbi:hypothetical protein V6246_01255 [Algibacter sp. TI.3.09]|uniref:hypothetical protein n=1 Tax=Algibacter sp. TI.3.09 TaxID=3121298 RepID=UPI00311F1DFC